MAKTTSVLYSDLSTQVANGSGYTTGGYNTGTTAASLYASGTCSATAQCAIFKASSTSTWGSTASFSTATAVHCYGTTIATAGNPLVCYNDLTSGGGTSQTVTSGTLTLTWNATYGVFSITISAEA